MKKQLLILSLIALALYGCAQVSLEVTEYKPQNIEPKPIESFIKDINYFSLHDDPSFEVDATIYEYNNIISLLISVKNKTGEDLEPEHYSISLADGRDHKPIKMLSRDDMLAIRAKYAGVSKGAIQDQVIEATMSNALKVANMPTKEKVIDLMTLGISKYFSFRKIYSKETREGVICFIADFKLEYPLTLSLKIKNRTLPFIFIPDKVTH
ncbi:MAG: hypothetical protein WCV91_00310 [Candidatus Margulisiibacteriota bacterium]